jgi:hypothetical protein
MMNPSRRGFNAYAGFRAHGNSAGALWPRPSVAVGLAFGVRIAATPGRGYSRRSTIRTGYPQRGHVPVRIRSATRHLARIGLDSKHPASC